MKTKSRLFAAVGAAAIASCLASPATAGGTAQGTSIQNSVSVQYSVGGNAQTAAVASDEFKVDRKVSMTLTNSGTAASEASPNGTAAIAFLLTNTSNDTLDFSLAASNGGVLKHIGDDDYDVTGFEYYVENGAAGFQGTETKITVVEDLPADESRTIYVVAKTPQAQVTGDTAGVTLLATALASDGAALTQAAVNTAGVETVFADDLSLLATSADRRDGKVKDSGGFIVKGAGITATKTSKILWDPVNLLANPKMIPGAIVEYCIAVRNAKDSATATNVTITDVLQGTNAQNVAISLPVSYLAINIAPLNSPVGTPAGIGVRLNGGIDLQGGCDATGLGTGTYANGVVSGTLDSIAAEGVKTLMFRVTVN